MDEEEPDDMTGDAFVPVAPAARARGGKGPEKSRSLRGAKWDDETKKKRPSFLDNEPEQKKTAGSSRDAAADMLKQFFQHRP